MVERQLVPRGIAGRVLDAMRTVPREAFTPEAYRAEAYHDLPLPIGEGQTISQPYVVALMVQALALCASDRVLDVGTGSGYAAAVLSRLVHVVYTIERLETLAHEAQARFDELGYDNIEVRHGDGTLGWPERAPFDAINIAAGGPDVPMTLKAQLVLGGRLVIPVGPSRRRQGLVVVTRRGEQRWVTKPLGDVRFVPLIGAGGWQSEGR